MQSLKGSSETSESSLLYRNLSHNSIVDLEELLLSFDNDRDFVKELLVTYMQQSTPELLDALRQAVRTGNPKLLEEAAHRLKGAAGVIGATHVYLKSSVLEELGREKRLADVTEALKALEQAIEEFELYIQNHIKRYIPHFFL
jgi:HPt (histidine-containing phosphotransfer) domain-containing protein